MKLGSCWEFDRYEAWNEITAKQAMGDGRCEEGRQEAGNSFCLQDCSCQKNLAPEDAVFELLDTAFRKRPHDLEIETSLGRIRSIACKGAGKTTVDCIPVNCSHAETELR